MHWPLWKQLLATMLGATVAITFATGWVYRSLESSYLEGKMTERNRQVFKLLSAAATEAVIVEDGPVLETIINQSVASMPDIHAVTVWNEDGQRLAQWEKDKKIDAIQQRSFADRFVFEGETFGRLEATWDLSHQYAEIEGHVGHIRLLVSGSLFMLTLLILAINHGLAVRHINKINQRVLDLAEGDLSSRISISASQELEHLAEAMNALASELQFREERENELLQHRDHLQELVAEQTADLKLAKEMAEKANKAKSEFLANMSHELRSPMTSIRSGLSTIKEVLLDPEADDEDKADMMQAIDFAQGSSERLLGLLNDILDLAKLEAGKMEFNIQPADLAEVIKQAMQEISSQAQAKSLSLKSDISTLDTVIPIDFGKMMQVVINLLNNAVKFTPEGREIIVSLTETNLPSGRRETDVADCPALKLIVSDQGVGVPEDELALIFDKFAQSKKTKDGSGGTGLGLSIVQNIVSKHNGSIHVENNPQGGARFIVSIPKVLYQPDNDGLSCSVSVQGKTCLAANGLSPSQEA